MELFVAGKLKARRVTIFFEDDEYGRGLRDSMIGSHALWTERRGCDGAVQ